MVLRPRQHSIGYMGDSFTGRKTLQVERPNQQYQSTEEKKLQRKTRKKKKTQNTHIQLYIQNSRQKRYTYKAQQVP